MEIYWRDSYTCPSVEEYQEMTKRSKHRVKSHERVLTGPVCFYEEEKLWCVPEYMKFTHAFFALWHPEYCQLFPVALMELLIILATIWLLLFL
jgi:hypothetical protein